MQALCVQQFNVFFLVYLKYLGRLCNSESNFGKKYEEHQPSLFLYPSCSELLFKYSIGRNISNQVFPFFQLDTSWVDSLLNRLQPYTPSLLESYDLLSLPEHHLPFDKTRNAPKAIAFAHLPFVLWINQQDHLRFIGTSPFFNSRIMQA